MDILHLNSTDKIGGAARAAYRLHSMLESWDINSKMLVQHRYHSDKSVYGTTGIFSKLMLFIRRKLDSSLLLAYPDRKGDLFSPAWLPERRKKDVCQLNPDIIHLHWLGNGFVQPSTIGDLNNPIVWTLHDMWPFTGGCHVAGSCKKYKYGCNSCPHLGSSRQNDLSNSVWERKKAAWKHTEFNLVAPSQWMANCAGESRLFSGESITVIPNGLDVDSFRPIKSTAIRDQFGVDSDTDLVCFGTSHHAHYKGFDLLIDALEYLTDLNAVEFFSFGPQHQHELPTDIDVTHLGYLEDERLQQLYSDADVVIVPSRVESFGQVASESLASGTPVVAFNSTGLKDVVSHKKTGYLADAFDPKDLADGVKWVLRSQERTNQLSHRARSDAKDRFSIETVASQYHDLYEETLRQVTE